MNIQPHSNASDTPDPYEALGVTRTAGVDESEWYPSVRGFSLNPALLYDSPSIVQAKGFRDSP